MKKLLSFFSSYQKIIFFLITFTVGLWILAPLHNFQMGLAQGDHGRDLYAFSQTMSGATPYQDYFWTYGPLMPYYYGLLFKVLGASLQSALCGEMLLKLLTAILFYFALGCFVPFFWACLGSLWLASFYAHFPHTFNHAGGVSLLVLLILNLFLYLKTQHQKFFWLGLLTVVLVSLVKINFGASGFVAFLLSSVLIDLSNKTFQKNLKRYAAGALLTGGAIFLIHLWFVRKLPFYYILQCFSLLKSYQQTGYAAHSSIWQNSASFIQGTFMPIITFWPFLILMLTVMALFIFLIVSLVKENNNPLFRKKTFLALITTSRFVVLSLHEAFLSIMPYAKYWAQPFQLLFVFLVIGLAAQRLPRFFQAILALFLCAILWTNTERMHRIVGFFKNPMQHFQLGKNNAFVTNAANWFLTVHQTVSFLNSRLGPHELFFALPYEPLYYFLTNRQSPVREIEFFTFMNITPEQERDIIAKLENKKVNYVLLSNRCQSDEAGLGTLGQTYCPLLAQYILNNFTLLESFGDWGQPAGWIDHHAVRILKRKIR